MKKRGIEDYSFAHLTLILLLHYRVKCRSRTMAVYNNEPILSLTMFAGGTPKISNRSFKIASTEIPIPGIQMHQSIEG